MKRNPHRRRVSKRSDLFNCCVLITQYIFPLRSTKKRVVLGKNHALPGNASINKVIRGNQRHRSDHATSRISGSTWPHPPQCSSPPSQVSGFHPRKRNVLSQPPSAHSKTTTSHQHLLDLQDPSRNICLSTPPHNASHPSLPLRRKAPGGGWRRSTAQPSACPSQRKEPRTFPSGNT